MADGFVNQQYAQRAAQEEQQSQQRMYNMMNLAQQMEYRQNLAAHYEQQTAMEQARLQFAQRQAQAEEEDRQFKTVLHVMGADWIDPVQKAAYINQSPLKQRLGIQGDITPEGVEPFYKLTSELADDVQNNRPIEEKAGLVEFFNQNPKFITMRNAPILAQANARLQEKRAREVAEQLNQKPQDVQYAETFVQAEKPNYDAYRLDKAREAVNIHGGDIVDEGVAGVGGLRSEGGPTTTKAYREEYAKQMLEQGWPEGSPYRLAPPEGERVAFGPYQEARSMVSPAISQWQDDRDQFIREYERQQAIVKGDLSRQRNVDMLGRALMLDPDALKKAHALSLQGITGMRIAGIGAKEVLEDKALTILQKPGPYTKEEQQIIDLHDTMSGDKAVTVGLRIRALQEHVQEQSQKQAVLEEARGIQTQTEFTFETSRITKELEGLADQLKNTTDPEQINQIKIKEQGLKAELQGATQARDEAATLSSQKITALAQGEEARVRMLLDQRRRTRPEDMPALEAQIAEAQSHAKLYGRLVSDLSTYSASTIATMEHKLVGDKARRDILAKSPDTEKDAYLTEELKALNTSIPQSEEWLKTANQKRGSALAQLQAHTNYLTRQKGRTTNQIDKLQAKQEGFDKETDAVNYLFERIYDFGIPAQQAFTEARKMFPGVDPKRVEEIVKSRGSMQEHNHLILAQQEWLRSDQSDGALAKISAKYKVPGDDIRKASGPAGAREGLTPNERINAITKAQAMAAHLAGASEIMDPVTGQMDFGRMMQRSAEDRGTYLRALKMFADLPSFAAIKPDLLKMAAAHEVEFKAIEKGKAEVSGAMEKLPAISAHKDVIDQAMSQAAQTGQPYELVGSQGTVFTVNPDGTFTDKATGHKFKIEGKGKNAKWTTVQ